MTPLRCGKKYNSLTAKAREKLPFRQLFHFKQPNCPLIFSLGPDHLIEGCLDTKIRVQKDGLEVVAKRLVLADHRKRILDQMERPVPPPQSGKKSTRECSTDRCNELIANLSQSTTVQRLLRSIASFGPTPIISCLDCSNNNIGINTTTRAVLYDSTPLQILVYVLILCYHL